MSIFGKGSFFDNTDSPSKKDEKSWFDRTEEALAENNKKDGTFLDSQADNFVEEAGFDRLFNNETGEQAPNAETESEIVSKQTPRESGQTESEGITDPNLVTPDSAVDDPLYKAQADSQSYEIERPGKANETDTIPGKKNVNFSVFNHWSLYNYTGGPFESITQGDYNNPLHTGPDNAQFRNPTASKIIEVTKERGFPAYRYGYSDFALAKYYGKIPNNYMITLRRFPTAVEDNIINPNVIGPNGEVIDKGMPDMSRAVTWMDEATGNKLEDILKFDTKLAWKEVTSQMQELQAGSGRGGMLGNAIGSNFFMSSIYGAANGMDATAMAKAKQGHDPVKGTYPNHVFGPINVIKQVMVRDQGLEFNQGFDLKFHYSLRQLKGVSPKIAFLDMMSNLLVLTYNNGNFWGGDSRYAGGGGSMRMKPFGDMSKLKSGDFGGYLGSLMGGAIDGFKNIMSDFGNGAGMLESFANSKLGNNIIGGGLMKLFGTPQGSEAINALLTGDATGQWHVTIGNPLMPIATIGNLVCEGTDFQFSGELSHEGFPTELTVTVKLKPGRPRDKADIERMFNGGKERMYLTPVGGVNTNLNATNSAYGNADTADQAEIYRKMTNG